MSERELMDLVRQYRVLYDKGVKGFRDRTLKENAWSEIAQKLNMTPKEAECKYNSQRTMFGRYIKQLKPASGAGRESVIVKPEFEHMRWLICHIDHRRTSSNLAVAMDMAAASPSVSESLSDQLSSPQQSPECRQNQDRDVESSNGTRSPNVNVDGEESRLMFMLL